MKRFLILLISFFPLVVSASTLGYAGAYQSGCTSATGVGPSHLCQKYTVDGEAATCLDPAVPNPDIGKENLTETTLTVDSSSYAKGLIAIANYASINGMSELEIAHAYRIYTAKADPRSGDVINISSVAGASAGGSIGSAVNIGMCAYGSGSCSDLSNYLPSSGSGSQSGSVDGKEFTITKTGQDNSINGKNFTVIAGVSINGAENVTPTSCQAEGFSCSIQNVQGTSFDVKVSGTLGNKSSVKVYITFNGASNGSLISEINLYSCESGSACSSKYGAMFGFQRFIKIKPSEATDPDKKYITINLPSICESTNLSTADKLAAGCCDAVDPSTLIEDSIEEEKYIESCGPIVVIENECGADSCNDSDYKDYTHSYVRQRPMKSIMKALDNGQKSSLGDYVDYTVNDYCGVYTSEKVDTLMPATAVSVSGQFFIFDKYNDLNCTTEVPCLRQPYISGKIKATFFTDYKKWKSDYDSAKAAEISTYNSWQSAVKAIKPAYDAYIQAKNYYESIQYYRTSCPMRKTVCSYDSEDEPNDCHSVTDQDACNQELDRALNDMNSKEQTWITSYSVTEPNAQSAYKNAVSRRMGLQDMKEECKKEDNSFKNDFEYDFSPKLQFLYSQTSQKNGTKDYTMNMVSNTSSVKYWPNTTTSNMSNVDYLGENAINLDKDTAQNPNIKDLYDTFQRKGVYTTDIYGNTTGYSFPDNSHDSCSGAMCTRYDYTDKSFTSIKTISNDATDPYDKITNKDEISMIYFYRPDKNTFALMNTGEYKTLDYSSNDSITQMNGLEVGYVYNLELTAYKGQYTTNFLMNNVGYKGSNGGGYTQKLIDDKVNEIGIDSFASTCNYCNYEMAFKRECPECNPEDPGGEFTAQFYYRSISLSDVNPNDKPEGETNWSDSKGLAAEKAIEAVSGKQIIGNVNDNTYLAMLDENSLNKQNVPELDYTYLAESSSYDIYDDESREFLEYEITLTPKDMQIIKKNSAKANFDYAKMNMCGVSIPTTKDVDNDYCFKCTKDMKECESSFVTAFFSEETDLNKTRTKKWKYYVNGLFCKGSINSCLGGTYPDPVFAKSYLAENKNWP